MLTERETRKIQDILLADCFQTPLFRVLFALVSVELYDKRIRGGRAKTQEELNHLYSPTSWNLAERYTDIIKTLFVGIFYSPIIPTALMITSLAMVTTYICDKYSLIHLWRRPPMLGAKLAHDSRLCFILIVWTHVFMARSFFSNWPFRDYDKAANCGFWWCYNYSKDYLNSAQKRAVVIYSIGFIVVRVCHVCVYMCMFVCICVCLPVFVSGTHDLQSCLAPPVSCRRYRCGWLSIFCTPRSFSSAPSCLPKILMLTEGTLIIYSFEAFTA